MQIFVKDKFSRKSVTAEIEAFFPSLINKSSKKYFQVPITSSLFGAHSTANTTTSDPIDYTWSTEDSGSFQVFAVRNDADSPNVRFMLTSSNDSYSLCKPALLSTSMVKMSAIASLADVMSFDIEGFVLW